MLIASHFSILKEHGQYKSFTLRLTGHLVQRIPEVDVALNLKSHGFVNRLSDHTLWICLAALQFQAEFMPSQIFDRLSRFCIYPMNSLFCRQGRRSSYLSGTGELLVPCYAMV